jgi:hypothetical protein
MRIDCLQLIQRKVGLTLTPKAFANFSPWFERSENPGYETITATNAESVCFKDEPFQGLD